MLSMPIKFSSLKIKFPVTITVIVAAVGFTIGSAIIIQDWFRFRDALEEKALLLAHSVAISATEPILQNDSWTLYKNLIKIASNTPDGMKNSLIISGMVLDPKGIILAHINPAEHPIGIIIKAENEVDKRILPLSLKTSTAKVAHGGNIFNDPFVEGIVPIYSDHKKLGIVRLRLTTDELYSQSWQSAFTVFGITSIFVIIGSIFGSLISQKMVSPLIDLTKGMKSISRGEYDNLPKSKAKKGDEIWQLTHSFQKMASELEDKKRLEDEMAVNEKLVALGRISAGVAHEVNNPLAGILNCLDTLKKHPDDRKLTNRYLPIIEKGLNRIRLIVTGLLVELRVEDAKEFSGPTCLDELRELIMVEVGDRPINISWENKLKEDIILNHQRIQQVVLNLLKNSFQAIKDEGIVCFRAFDDGTCLILEVEDDGPGISEEDLGRLFDPFFTTRTDGTGLGLWIVYRLVLSMGGKIDVSSVFGEGTKFQIFLPIRQMYKLSEDKESKIGFI